MATILKTNGERKEVSPKNGSDFQLDELQSIVGGYIEILNLSNNRLMLVNEEGKIYGLPYNHEATELVVKEGYHDVIVGDVLVCENSQVR